MAWSRDPTRPSRSFTPVEDRAQVEPSTRAVLADANVPASVRGSGCPVPHGSASELDALLGEWLAADPEGVAGVIGTGPVGAPETYRVRVLPRQRAHGPELDPVVLLDPGSLATSSGQSTGRSP